MPLSFKSLDGNNPPELVILSHRPVPEKQRGTGAAQQTNQFANLVAKKRLSVQMELARCYAEAVMMIVSIDLSDIVSETHWSFDHGPRSSPGTDAWPTARTLLPSCPKGNPSSGKRSKKHSRLVVTLQCVQFPLAIGLVSNLKSNGIPLRASTVSSPASVRSSSRKS